MGGLGLSSHVLFWRRTHMCTGFRVSSLKCGALGWLGFWSQTALGPRNLCLYLTAQVRQEPSELGVLLWSGGTPSLCTPTPPADLLAQMRLLNGGCPEDHPSSGDTHGSPPGPGRPSVGSPRGTGVCWENLLQKELSLFAFKSVLSTYFLYSEAIIYL